MDNQRIRKTISTGIIISGYVTSGFLKDAKLLYLIPFDKLNAEYEVTMQIRQRRTFMIIYCILFSIILIFISTPALFAFGQSVHRLDILASVYGYDLWEKDNWDDIPKDVQESYEILSYAATYAIDYNGTRQSNQPNYKKLQENINKTSHPFVLPNISEFTSLGQGTHRAYNHQGFYYQYEERTVTIWENEESIEENKYRRRWLLGRDELLIPATAAAFGLDLNDPRAEVIAIFAYYSHMIGDVAAGEESSIKQMGKLSEFFSLLQELKRESKIAMDRTGRTSQNFDNMYIDVDYVSTIAITQFSDPTESYRYIRSRFMEKYFPKIIEDLLGKPISNISIGVIA